MTLTHSDAAALARKSADRADRRRTYTPAPSRTEMCGSTGVPWIVTYMRHYRRLTGRPGYAGPAPVWRKATS